MSNTYDFALRLDDPVNTHAIQFELVPPGTHVLDVGCYTGILGMTLRDQKGCHVDGVDADRSALDIAVSRLEQVSQIDLEANWVDTLRQRSFGPYDVIIFGDVLEHTKEPEAVLKAARTLLKPGGRVIVSLPNVAYLVMRIRLLQGRFDYKDSGILDRTHLRFFTLRSARELIHNAGFRIVEERYSGYVLSWGSSLPRWLLERFPTILASGFVFAIE
jgi:methionine biosynthesis protein MetW